MFKVDLPQLFSNTILEERREPDGKLHCSTDLTTPLRFVQLRHAGAPMIPRPIAQHIRLHTGTLWHNWFHDVIKKNNVEFEYEVKLDDWLPYGWAGTADWVFYDKEHDAWTLGDLKTIKGEGIQWIYEKGAKDEHIAQLSAYWGALVNQGRPMYSTFGILYWPLNDTSGGVEPVLHECTPIPTQDLWAAMDDRRAKVDAYVNAVNNDEWLIPELADMPEREQRIYWNKSLGVFDLKLIPSWWEAYCDFDNVLCPRSNSEKIGHYTVENRYVPRSGYDVEPLVAPTAAQYKSRR